MNRIPMLDALDPGRDDPGYWHRLHRNVMAAVAPELARRRMLARSTVPELVHSWSRTLVPASLLAAVVAGFLLVQAPTGPSAATDRAVEQLAEGPAEALLEPMLASPGTGGDDGSVWFAGSGF